MADVDVDRRPCGDEDLGLELGQIDVILRLVLDDMEAMGSEAVIVVIEDIVVLGGVEWIRVGIGA